MRCRVLTILALVLTGCRSGERGSDRRWFPAPAPDLGAVVAQVGEVPILAEQVRAMARQEGISARQALNILIDRNLLAERARRSGQDLPTQGDPEVAAAMVQRLLEVEIEPRLRYDVVPDSALLPLYERAREGFVHGRLVELGVLAIYTGARMPEDLRAKRRASAHALDEYLKKNPPKTIDEWKSIARDSQWSSKGVVYDRFVQSMDRPLSRVVGEQASKLRALGETMPMVEDEDGFFIGRYLGEQPPSNVSFAEARPKLLAGYYDRWRQQEFLDFSGKRMRLHRVEAHFDRLAQDGKRP